MAPAVQMSGMWISSLTVQRCLCDDIFYWRQAIYYLGDNEANLKNISYECKISNYQENHIQKKRCTNVMGYTVYGPINKICDRFSLKKTVVCEDDKWSTSMQSTDPRLDPNCRIAILHDAKTFAKIVITFVISFRSTMLPIGSTITNSTLRQTKQ